MDIHGAFSAAILKILVQLKNNIKTDPIVYLKSQNKTVDISESINGFS